MSADRPRLAAAPQRLFVYGSLTFPEVLSALLGRTPAETAAAAPGWRAAALRDRLFPGLVPAPGRVHGKVLAGLTPTEWSVLDDFEGPFYELRPLRLEDGGTAHAYVCTAAELVLEADWDRTAFARRHLGGYVTMCARWRERRPTT